MGQNLWLYKNYLIFLKRRLLFLRKRLSVWRISYSYNYIEAELESRFSNQMKIVTLC